MATRQSALTARREMKQIGEYVIEAELGRGGMGLVYRGRHETSGRVVAIKVLRPDLVDEKDAVRRFRVEIEAVRAVNHPNVVRYLEAGLHEDHRLYIVFEYLDARPLSLVIGPDMPLDTAQIVRIVNEVGAGLGAVHPGTIHRDLNPVNILLAREETGETRAFISDFGIAKLWGDLANVSTERRLLGKVGYTSPEQDVDARRVDFRSDIYSFSVLTFEMFADGKLPWSPGTTIEVMDRKRRDPTPDLRALCPRLSIEQAEVLMKGMAAKPQRRFSSAPEFAAALTAACRYEL